MCGLSPCYQRRNDLIGHPQQRYRKKIEGDYHASMIQPRTRERRIASPWYRKRDASFRVVSRSYIFQASTWPLVSTQRVWIPICTHTCARYVRSLVRGAIRPIRFASRVHAHAKSGRYLRIASTLALKAHSVTPRRSRLIASAKPLPPKAPAKITEKEPSRRSQSLRLTRPDHSFSPFAPILSPHSLEHPWRVHERVHIR